MFVGENYNCIALKWRRLVIRSAGSAIFRFSYAKILFEFSFKRYFDFCFLISQLYFYIEMIACDIVEIHKYENKSLSCYVRV